MLQVDQQGHATGPASEEVKDKLRYVDDFAKSIYDMLLGRNLTEIVDVIFVSDHGMTQTANERLAYLDEVLGEDGFAGIAHKEGWPSCGLRFKEGIDEELMVTRMKEAARASNGGFAYYNHETMPEEWHFAGSPRIAPHWLVPE
jgi:predicted AlkP superfamily pyrophosphatase or phosphodiesterase